jgi:hypothetical protein
MLWTEHSADLIGGGAGCYVEIMRFGSHECVPHAASREIGGMASGYESMYHLLGELKIDRL